MNPLKTEMKFAFFIVTLFGVFYATNYAFTALVNLIS